MQVEAKGHQPDVDVCSAGSEVSCVQTHWLFVERPGWLWTTRPRRPTSCLGGSGLLLTCDVLLDLVDFADGVVSSEHVQVEGLGVSADARPRADVRRRPPANANSVVRLRGRSQRRYLLLLLINTNLKRLRDETEQKV